MFAPSLTEQAAGCFYGDKQLAERLWQALLQEPDSFGGWPALQEECFQLLVEGVDARNPREYRLTDIRHLMGVLCTGDLLLTGELPWLGELFSRLFTRNGDLLCYRETQVQAYVRIAAELDPTLLVAWHLCDWLQQSPAPSPHDIQRVLSAQTAFFAPPGNPELLFAEGHVHFGGITADSAILDDYLFAGRELTLYEKASPWHQQQHQLLLPQLDRVRRLLALLLAPLEKPVTNGGQEKYHSSMQAYWLRDPMRNGLSLPDWPTMAAMYATAK